MAFLPAIRGGAYSGGGYHSWPCWVCPLALAGPSRSCKAVASLDIQERGSVLPQIPVSYCLSLCSGGKSCCLYRKASLASEQQTGFAHRRAHPAVGGGRAAGA